MTIAVCTGCKFTIWPGPYFHRRIMRHLNDGQHNHDAAEIKKIVFVMNRTKFEIRTSAQEGQK